MSGSIGSGGEVGGPLSFAAGSSEYLGTGGIYYFSSPTNPSSVDQTAPGLGVGAGAGEVFGLGANSGTGESSSSGNVFGNGDTLSSTSNQLNGSPATGLPPEVSNSLGPSK